MSDHCTTAACWWAALTGAAPHMLDAVGPLAGTALVAGLGDRCSSGCPAMVLVASVAVFPLSAFVTSPNLMAGDAAELPVRPQDSQVEHPHGG